MLLFASCTWEAYLPIDMSSPVSFGNWWVMSEYPQNIQHFIIQLINAQPNQISIILISHHFCKYQCQPIWPNALTSVVVFAETNWSLTIKHSIVLVFLEVWHQINKFHISIKKFSHDVKRPICAGNCEISMADSVALSTMAWYCNIKLDSISVTYHRNRIIIERNAFSWPLARR